MGQFILIALATFVSEDLTCIATGALIASGKIGFVPGVLACITGIFFGDLLLYFAGRLHGPADRAVGPMRRFSGQKLDLASAWLTDRGAMVVILSRFTPGLRLANLCCRRPAEDAILHLCRVLPVGRGSVDAAAGGRRSMAGEKPAAPWVVCPAVLLVAIHGVSFPLPAPHGRRRRRLLGWFRRRTRWEFWPPWLAYIPVIPYILYLGIKHRSLTLFTAANPGIPRAGFVGESKSAILAQLARVPDFTLLSGSLPADLRFRGVKDFMTARYLTYPDSSQTRCR